MDAYGSQQPWLRASVLRRFLRQPSKVMLEVQVKFRGFLGCLFTMMVRALGLVYLRRLGEAICQADKAERNAPSIPSHSGL
jgi:hypothetical protein